MWYIHDYVNFLYWEVSLEEMTKSYILDSDPGYDVACFQELYTWDQSRADIPRPPTEIRIVAAKEKQGEIDSLKSTSR